MAHLTCESHKRRVWVNPDSLRIAHREDHSECEASTSWPLKMGHLFFAPWEVVLMDKAVNPPTHTICGKKISNH